jgi:hypothetical protein
MTMMTMMRTTRTKESTRMSSPPRWPKSKAAALAKKACPKMTGREAIDIDSPPRKKSRGDAAHATTYFSMSTTKGYMVNLYSVGSKNSINLVFHKVGFPPQAAEPILTLDLGVRPCAWSESCLINSSLMNNQ